MGKEQGEIDAVYSRTVVARTFEQKLRDQAQYQMTAKAVVGAEQEGDFHRPNGSMLVRDRRLKIRMRL